MASQGTWIEWLSGGGGGLVFCLCIELMDNCIVGMSPEFIMNRPCMIGLGYSDMLIAHACLVYYLIIILLWSR